MEEREREVQGERKGEGKRRKEGGGREERVKKTGVAVLITGTISWQYCLVHVAQVE